MANKVFKTKYQSAKSKLITPKVKLIAIASLVTCLVVSAGFGAYQLVSSTPTPKFEQANSRVNSVRSEQSTQTSPSPQSYFDQKAGSSSKSTTSAKQKKKAKLVGKKSSKKKSTSVSKNGKNKRHVASHKSKKSKHHSSLKNKGKKSLAKKNMNGKKNKKFAKKAAKKSGKNVVAK